MITVPRLGLDASAVTAAAAALADEIGFPQLGMNLVAERIGVKTPSLYKHVNGLADLTHRIAVLAAHELGDALRDAIQGLAGRDALAAAANALRLYIRAHPGRYAALNERGPTGPNDPLSAAIDRLLNSFGAILYGYRIDPADQIHALRLLRSFMYGFATIEVAGGFRLQADSDDSFAWMIDFIDRGLRTSGTV
ncbi:TetR-like C-terminal domain-containing protein [Lysinibacter sp. HNR]|uniref:TetR/AcrR family transcriptional regulator n=1 Tax=Lysinibacter sp. HNR TaxID=3031408 RepID=UPI002434A293|nr:TetR-like C-terminal domain-containing protein [Lysinibacter sp. HNR]WGD36261.1 TetR-like C-terminal domain-containing protein [Lysinibacter sp. HNR]